MSLTDVLLGPAPGPGPLITYYDDATGERVELSGATTANWVAKAANLLRDECDVEPGTRVAVLLPAHWQTAVVLLAVWSCGGELVSDPAAADWVLADAAHLDAGPQVVGLSLDAFGKGLPDPPAGVVDFATEVRLHGDEFVPWDPVPDDAPAWDGATVDEVLARVRIEASLQYLRAGDRVLSDLGWSDPATLREGLLAVLFAGASLVQVANPDPAAQARRFESERCTCRFLADLR